MSGQDYRDAFMGAVISSWPIEDLRGLVAACADGDHEAAAIAQMTDDEIRSIFSEPISLGAS